MIEFSDTVKEYGRWRRRVRALDGISLRILPGSAVGVVGPNGAGKSTLLRLLLGYLHPTAGAVRVAGQAPRHYAERHGIGYVPERPTVPTRWTVRGALHAYAAIGHVDSWQDRIAGAVRDLGLEPVAERRVAALSKGNLQRLVLAQALIGDRRLLILDEPTDGVDPEWRIRIRELLARWRTEDTERVLIFASHDLDEVERVADRVVVLADGRLRDLLELRPAAGPKLPPYRLVLDAVPGNAGGLVEETFPGALRLEPAAGDSAAAWRVTAADLPELNRRLAALLQRGATIRALTPESPSLEQRFRQSMRSD